jgi:leucyl-tRNA synthetase
MKLIECDEPFTNLLSQGMVVKFSPESGRIEKMSKSRGNVVGTTDFFNRYGADAARLFTLFASPPAQELEWSEDGAVGQHRFLSRIWRYGADLIELGVVNPASVKAAQTKPIVHAELDERSKVLHQLVHKTIKSVTADLNSDRYVFNTAIARCMELVNGLYKFTNESVPDGSTDPKSATYTEDQKSLLILAMKTVLLLLAPMAPHITEELWDACGYKDADNKLIHVSSWPTYEEALTVDNLIELVLQVNGKIISKVSAPRGLARTQAEEIAFSDGKMRTKIEGQPVRKVIVVPDKLVNVVI